MTALTHRIPLSDNWWDPPTSVVYRAFAENGDLLYVGVTNDPYHRFCFHEVKSYWWGHVQRIEISQEFMDRWVAEDAEKKAIRDLQPIYNRWYPTVPERAEDLQLEWQPFEYTNAAIRAAS